LINFAYELIDKSLDLQEYKVLTLTHQAVGLRELGQWVLHGESNSDQLRQQLQHIKDELGIDEFMYLATCNRITFLFTSPHAIDTNFLQQFFNTAYAHLSQDDVRTFVEKGRVFEGEEAVRHILNVASSLDSMVLGEREIYKQLKDAYQASRDMALSGDSIRLLMERALVTVKRIFNETAIAQKPISVASLAVSGLAQKDIPQNTHIFMVGAGQTNNLVAKYLRKYGFTNVTVANRSLSNARALAERFEGQALTLEQMRNYDKPFDVLIACTSATQPTISYQLFHRLAANGGQKQKQVIDLGVPHDIDPELTNEEMIDYITVEDVKQVAEQNRAHREREKEKALQIISEDLGEFRVTHKQRQVEKALGTIPDEVSAIREKALSNVFRKDIEQMDDDAKEVLERVVNYLEKKYVGIPMSIAKEELIKRELIR